MPSRATIRACAASPRPASPPGPCLLKDTLQLAAFSQNNFFLGHAAMLINEGLPMFLVQQLRPHDLPNKRVAILGMGFKAESDDKRDSLSYKLKKLLEVEALEVLCTDPYVPDQNLVPLETALRKADIIIVGAPHAVYKDIDIPAGKVVLDPWNFLPARQLASRYRVSRRASSIGPSSGFERAQLTSCAR